MKKMNNIFLGTATLFYFFTILVIGCCFFKKNELSVLLISSAIYQCENNDRIDVKYYSLSDKSLNFIKVALPDGKVHTLAQSVSASGARYTNEKGLVWWVKGDAATMDLRDGNGDWKIKHTRCRISAE